MNLLSIMTLLLFASTLMQADYIRSIRLGSFPNEKEALISLEKVDAFVNTQPNLQKLKSERSFRFKARASGKYYVTVAEPFTDRKVLQETLDTLRLKYPDIYVTKLKEMPKIKAIPSIEETIIPEEIQEKNITQKQEVLIPEEELHEEEIKEVTNEVSTQEPQASYTYLYITLIFILVIFLLMGFILLFKYKREIEHYVDQEMIDSQKLKKSHQELEMKEKLLSHVSHELRTPMTAIMGLAHLVLESELSKLQKDYVLKIESSSQHLLNLVNDLLDVSKMEAGELQIEKAEFNINDILEYILNVNAMAAKRNGTALTMDVALDIPSKVVGDSLRLGQVLINLMGNAIKFTKNGEVSLSVKKLSIIGESLKLEFTVSDNGIGMTKEQVDNIFNSYYQADNDTSRKYGGTGLGLTISKELIEMMGGEIKVSSTKDVGTTFSFTVNLQLKDSQNKRYYRLPSSKMLHKNILIVDASNKNVIPLMKSLGYFNYKTVSLSVLEEGSLEKDADFDILMINQYSLTQDSIKIIKDLQQKHQTKIVIINDLFSNLDASLLERLSVDAYLQVPTTQQSILNVLVDLYVAKNLDKRSRKVTLKDKLKVMAKKKILVAEDNDVNQKVIQGLLADTGIELIFVDDGQEAVDLVRKDVHFDLIIMDINMPNLNGYEASKEIRKSSKYNHIPILALTGDVTQESVAKSFASGMQGHISKPIIVDIFYKKIYDALKLSNVDFKIVLDKESTIKKNEDGFEELSVSVGLGRCHGDSEFYISILKDFKSMYSNSSKILQELCESGDFKKARKMSMDIKDVALNIGAYHLCESAATMEYEFEKGERSSWREFITSYDLILVKLFKDIDKYLASV